MKEELVSFKGMADGVRVCIHSSSPMFDILEELDRKINSNKNFFGDGNCRVCFYGREFTGGERQRLEQLLNGLLPLSRIEFEPSGKKKTYNKEWIEEYKKRYNKEKDEECVCENAEEIKNTDENNETDTKDEEYEFLSVLKSSRARFYSGTVKEGMSMNSEGHLVLLGTVETGGSLEAVGNIIVIGGLYGKAHAGCNGHNGSYVLAMDMMPQKLSIAGVSEEYIYPEEDFEQKEVENTETNRISFFEKLKKKHHSEEKKEKNTPKTEKSAVALCKNNKIIIDNFTIQAFTNLKNMI